jgi:hypothetical protein
MEWKNVNACQATMPYDTMFDHGILGPLIKKYDWESTPLGSIETWPQSLLTSVGVMLSSKYPIILFWGPELIIMYNDAYIPVSGARHPSGLGKPCVDVW